MKTKFNNYINENLTFEEVTNLDEYIAEIEQEKNEAMEKYKNKKNKLRSFLVDKHLKIIGKIGNNGEEKEHNIFVDDITNIYYNMDNKLIFREWKNEFGNNRLRHYFISKILKIREPKKVINEMDPYGEEDWDD